MDRLTGVMTVRSGRWLPPAHGWLLRITSPSFNLFPSDLICTETKKHDILSVRKECLFFGVSAACLNSHPSPGTGPSLAWPPGGQGCGAHWTLNHRPVQTQHRRSRDAPWCWWRWRFFGELYPSVLQTKRNGTRQSKINLLPSSAGFSPKQNLSLSYHALHCRCTCYAHEAVGEDGELHGVELSAEGAVPVRA